MTLFRAVQCLEKKNTQLKLENLHFNSLEVYFNHLPFSLGPTFYQAILTRSSLKNVDIHKTVSELRDAS